MIPFSLQTILPRTQPQPLRVRVCATCARDVEYPGATKFWHWNWIETVINRVTISGQLLRVHFVCYDTRFAEELY